MAQNVTVKEIEGLLAKRLSEQSNNILQAVDTKFTRLEVRLNREHEEVTRSIQTLTDGLNDVRKSIQELTNGLDDVRKSIQELTATLNKFIQRVEAQEAKFEALNSKVEKITSFIKEKFGVEITA